MEETTVEATVGIGEMIAPYVTDPFVMIILGAIAALLQRVVDKNTDGEKVSLWGYIKKNPYRLAISVVGLLVGYSVLLQLGELTIINALGVGYFSHNVVESFAGKVNSGKLQEKAKEKEEADD